MSIAAPLAPTRVRVRSLNPVRLVDRIEPSLEFWADRLGFDASFRVVGEDGLEFATVRLGGLELHFRTRDSLDLDVPGLVDGDGRDRDAGELLHLEVDDLDAVLTRLDESEIVAGPRETIFGGSEAFVREPSGRILVLADRP